MIDLKGPFHFLHRWQLPDIAFRAADDSPGNIRLCAGSYGCRDHIIDEIIHIAGRNNPKTQGFCHRQKRCPINRLAVQLIFKRENPFGQPVLQRHILSVAAHQCHRGMSVTVIKRTHQELAAAVIDTSVIRFRFCLADISNARALCSYKHMRTHVEIFI